MDGACVVGGSGPVAAGGAAGGRHRVPTRPPDAAQTHPSRLGQERGGRHDGYRAGDGRRNPRE